MYPEVKRRPTKEVRVGKVRIGGENPVRVQSMTNTSTTDVEATLRQVHALYEAGCEIVRVAVPDEGAVQAFAQIVKESPVPIVADLHFTTKLGKLVLEKGAAGIRINPGTFKDKKTFLELVSACKLNDVCIRIGINAGSLEAEVLKKYGYPTPEAMVESALNWLELAVEKTGYENIKVSLKSSSWWVTAKACELFSEKSDFPLHLGVTEAGGLIPGTVKNTMALTYLLLKGIGDTIRISLTADPVEEVRVAYEILKNLGLRSLYPDIISCPTCGRCEVDLISLYKEVEKLLRGIKADIKVAVMGCVVNGPGEAKHADIGITGGKGVGFIFKKGKVIKKVPEEKLLEEFKKELEILLKEKNRA